MRGRLPLVHVPPKYSRWRGPRRETDEDLPDSHGPRNTALCYLTGDYVVILDDCTAVADTWLEVLLQIATRGAAARYSYRGVRDRRYKQEVNLRVEDGFVTLAKRPDVRIRSCGPASMKGNTGAYPLSVLKRIGGFDEWFSGSYGYVDIEVAIRAQRTECQFLMSDGLRVYEFEDTHEPYTQNVEAMTGQLNRPKLNKLGLELSEKKTRIYDWVLPRGPQPTLDELRMQLRGA